MIAIETNVLVHAHRRESREHHAAYAVLLQAMKRPERWAIPWPCVAEFFSVVTNAKLWKGAESTPAQAFKQLDVWTSAPSNVLLTETEDTFRHLSALALAGGIKGAAIHDARIAAICLSHGIEELLTADRDFSRFARLKTRNPFA